MPKIKSILLLTVTIIFLITVQFSTASQSITENPEIRGDLYKINIRSEFEAQWFSNLKVHPVLRLPNSYIIIADPEASNRISRSEFDFQLLASDISKSSLALDNSRDKQFAQKFPVLYQSGQLYLLRVEPNQAEVLPFDSQLSFRFADNIEIEYRQPRQLPTASEKDLIDIDAVVDLVEFDSIASYTNRLQAYFRRPYLSDSVRACANWLTSKFTDFGFDSIILDTFSTPLIQPGDFSINVIATKVGSVLPDHHIVIGAHYDGVNNSPAADDNGSGVAAVLEMARAIQQFDTRITYVFILFDAEEVGLLGSWDYANKAAARGDSIPFMLNLDMIGFRENVLNGGLYYGNTTYYIDVWDSIAGEMFMMNGVNEGTSGSSDHHPFAQNGFDALFVSEYNFSDVYHSPQDSTTHMSFYYQYKMTRISLATAFLTGETYMPFKVAFDFPEGKPEALSPEFDSEFPVYVYGTSGGTAVPNSAQLHYSINEGAYQSVPMVEDSTGYYTCSIPTFACFSRVRYYISAEEEYAGEFTDAPPAAPNQAITVQDIESTIDDNFEDDLGWTVYSDASEGQWERGIPIGEGDRGDPPTDYDGSGSCYLTDNRYGNSDIDFGTTNLVSPTFDMLGNSGEISFALWYSNYLGYAQDDVFKVYISNDDGQSWTRVMTIGPVENSYGGWKTYSFWVDEFIETTELMKLRFEAADINVASTVEAGIDAVLIKNYICNYYLCGDCNQDDRVNVSDAVFVINYVFSGGNAPIPYLAGDVNCDTKVNVSDAVYIINYVFSGGYAPCDTDGDGQRDCGAKRIL